MSVGQKFTAGPWVATPITENQPNWFVEWEGAPRNEDWNIAELYGPDAEPNAHLIAAAPALYEACWVALEYWRSGRDTDSNEGDGIMNRLIAALAKADGER